MDGVATIGFRLSSDREIDFYILTTYNDSDDILTLNGQIIAFRSFEFCNKAFKLFDKKVTEAFDPPSEVALVCDIVEAVNLIRLEDRDDSSKILNCLNTFFDAFRSLQLVLPKRYRTLLKEFANHLTFDGEINAFISTSNIEREQIFEAFSWCVGTFILSTQFMETD